MICRLYRGSSTYSSRLLSRQTLLACSARWHTSHTHSHSDHTHEHGWKSILPGQAHGHAHEDVPLKLAATKGIGKDDGTKITLIGFVSNIVLAGTKGAAGVAYHSDALVADAAHSMADIISDLVTLGTIFLSNRPDSPRWPLGRAKVDALGSICVSSLLFSGAVALASHSVHSIMGFASEHHDHLAAALTSPLALYIALGTIAIKEGLFRATMRVARRLSSSVLVAAAWHHRADALSTGVAVLGIGASTLCDISWADPLAGAFVAGLLAKAALQNVKRPIQALLDYSPAPSKNLENIIQETIQSSSEPCRLESVTMKVESGKLIALINLKFEGQSTLAQIEQSKKQIMDLLRSSQQWYEADDIQFLHK